MQKVGNEKNNQETGSVIVMDHNEHGSGGRQMPRSAETFPHNGQEPFAFYSLMSAMFC